MTADLAVGVFSFTFSKVDGFAVVDVTVVDTIEPVPISAVTSIPTGDADTLLAFP